MHGQWLVAMSVARLPVVTVVRSEAECPITCQQLLQPGSRVRQSIAIPKEHDLLPLEQALYEALANLLKLSCGSCYSLHAAVRVDSVILWDTSRRSSSIMLTLVAALWAQSGFRNTCTLSTLYNSTGIPYLNECIDIGQISLLRVNKLKDSFLALNICLLHCLQKP